MENRSAHARDLPTQDAGMCIDDVMDDSVRDKLPQIDGKITLGSPGLAERGGAGTLRGVEGSLHAG
jgi:hypothetical protein